MTHQIVKEGAKGGIVAGSTAFLGGLTGAFAVVGLPVVAMFVVGGALVGGAFYLLGEKRKGNKVSILGMKI